MKIALSRVLMAFGCIGIFADFQAVAQYGPQNGPAIPAASQPGPATPQNGGPNGSSQPAGAPMPQAAAAPMADNGLLIDNGLWDEASVGPCCSICGGGSCAPPDWYTLQGARVLSRSKNRNTPISFQAPPQGLYTITQLASATPGPASYQVKNQETPATAVITGPLGNSITNPYEVMSAKALGLDVAPGYDVTIGHYFCRDKNNNDHFVELTFWGLNSWSVNKALGGYNEAVYDETPQTTPSPQVVGFSGGSLRTPFPTPTEFPGTTPTDATLYYAFDHGYLQTFFYQSAMNNFEINGRFSPRGEPDQLVLHPDGRWRRECQPGTYMSYLYGLRFMQIDETFKFHSVGGIFTDPTNLSTLTNDSGDYDIVTHNDLLGLQIGAEMTFRKCRWAWGVEAKMGPYLNFSNQVSNVTAQAADIPNLNLPNVDRRLSGSRCEASLIGECGFQATYKFRPNLMGRASYDFMWITNLALATDQLQFVPNPVNRVNGNGMIFSQGVSLGLEWLW